MSDAWEVLSAPGKKGRSMEVLGLGVLARKAGYNDPLRPWWAMFACEDGALRPTLASIAMGYKIKTGGSDFMEFQKSGGYEHRVQRLGDGLAVAVVYKAAMFTLDPGPIDDTGMVEFVVLPDTGWDARAGLSDEEVQRAVTMAMAAKAPMRHGKTPGMPEAGYKAKAEVRALFASLTPLAALVAAYLDHRTGLPLLADPGYYLTLFLAMLAKGAATMPHAEASDRGRPDYVWAVDPGMGYGNPVVVSVSHKALGTIMAETVAIYMATR